MDRNQTARRRIEWIGTRQLEEGYKGPELDNQERRIEGTNTRQVEAELDNQEKIKGNRNYTTRKRLKETGTKQLEKY